MKLKFAIQVTGASLIILLFVTPFYASRRANYYISTIKKLIRQKKYQQAKRYLARINFRRFKKADRAMLAYYGGYIYYILAHKHYAHHYQAAFYFMQAYGLFRISRWKALCLINLGTLYFQFYNKSNRPKLERGVFWLNKLIKSYPKDPYYNDALFYLCLILKKLGNQKDYKQALSNLKSGRFLDDQIFWRNQFITTKKAIQLVAYYP